MILSKTIQIINFKNKDYEKIFYFTATSSSKTEVELIIINGKRYLSFEGYSDDSFSKRAFLIYTIDSSSSSVRMKAMDTFSASARYTLDGRRTNGDKGINIIRTEDGTVRKVSVK